MDNTSHPDPEAAMKNIAHQPAVTSQSRSFNYDKLQAVACITTSAAVSIGAIYWLIQQFL